MPILSNPAIINKGQKAFKRALAKPNALEIKSPSANFFLHEKYF